MIDMLISYQTEVFGIIDVAFQGFSRIVIEVDWMEMIAFGVVVMPPICCIANIMLANNICNLREDVTVHRYTLPFYHAGTTPPQEKHAAIETLDIM